MQRTELENAGSIQVLDHASADMPHATLETNHTCNLQCDFCYNEDRRNVKPLALLLDELGKLQQHRPRLHTITLLGGEPLLHPDICDVVRAVRRAGKLCQVMTNGVLFLEKNGTALLDRLRRAGVNRFALHVDRGQGDAAVVRQRGRDLYRLMESHRIHFSLTVTLDEASRGVLPGLVREGVAYRYFDGILAFMATDQDTPLHPENRLAAEHGHIRNDLGISAGSYVPSSLDKDEIRWLMYHVLIDHRSGRLMEISPRYNRLFTRLFRTIRGRNPFMMLISPAAAGMGSVFTWVAESLLQPGSALAGLRKIGGLMSLARSRFFFIAVGVPPETGAGKDVDICYHCPDATIRNGAFMPVCIADRISPLGTAGITEPRFQPVLDHLQDNG